jgi:hypothetical protein
MKAQDLAFLDPANRGDHVINRVVLDLSIFPSSNQ